MRIQLNCPFKFNVVFRLTDHYVQVKLAGSGFVVNVSVFFCSRTTDVPRGA